MGDLWCVSIVYVQMCVCLGGISHVLRHQWYYRLALWVFTYGGRDTIHDCAPTRYIYIGRPRVQQSPGGKSYTQFFSSTAFRNSSIIITSQYIHSMRAAGAMCKVKIPLNTIFRKFMAHYTVPKDTACSAYLQHVLKHGFYTHTHAHTNTTRRL